MPNQGHTQHNTTPDEPYDPLSMKAKQMGTGKKTTRLVGAVGPVDKSNERW